MAVRIFRGVRDQAVVAGSRILIVETMGCRRRVDSNICVMHDPGVPRPELQPPNEARGVDGNREHEDAKDVGALRGQCEWPFQREDEVRLSELPAFAPRARWRHVARIALGRALVRPALNQPDLRVAERMLSDERTVVGIRLPRRHEAALRHRGDLRGAPFRVRVREQAERRGPAGVMAHVAAIDDERRDVFGEGDLRLVGRVLWDPPASPGACRAGPLDPPETSRVRRRTRPRQPRRPRRQSPATLLIARNPR